LARCSPTRLRQRLDVAELNERGAQIVISQHPRRSAPLPSTSSFTKPVTSSKTSSATQGIALRADKTDQSFKAMIRLAAASSIRDESQQALVRSLGPPSAVQRESGALQTSCGIG